MSLAFTAPLLLVFPTLALSEDCVLNGGGSVTLSDRVATLDDIPSGSEEDKELRAGNRYPSEPSGGKRAFGVGM